MATTMDEAADFVDKDGAKNMNTGASDNLDNDDEMSSRVIMINPEGDYEDNQEYHHEYSQEFKDNNYENSQNESSFGKQDVEKTDHNQDTRDPEEDHDRNAHDGSTRHDDEDDEVQPLVLGGYDEPPSPQGGEQVNQSGEFPILDFADMDQLDFTAGSNAENASELSSFQPQIVSVQSGAQVTFNESSEKQAQNDKGTENNKSQSSTNKGKDSESLAKKDNRSRTSTPKSANEDSQVSGRLSQNSRKLSIDNDPVIILSDDDDDDDDKVDDSQKSDNDSERRNFHPRSKPKETCSDSRDSDTMDMDENLPSLTELQAAIERSNDPFIDKLIRLENMSAEEARAVAEEVRNYRKANNIYVDDDLFNDEDYDCPAPSPINLENLTPLKLVRPDAKGPGGHLTQEERLQDAEPVQTFPAPTEQEPEELTDAELAKYEQYEKYNKHKSLEIRTHVEKYRAVIGKRAHKGSKTVAELLAHQERGELPPGNYRSVEDYLVLEDPETNQPFTLLANDVPKIKEENDSKESLTKPSTNVKPPVYDDTMKNILKQMLTGRSSGTVTASTEPKTSKLVTKPTITMTTKNNQELPPEGGSTIILPDGTTIRMAPQQGFNITSTINVSGQQDENYEYEEGEEVYGDDEDELFNHMACPECGEVQPLDTIMQHLEDNHWKNNPSCYKCGTCDAWFFNKDDYHNHLSRVVEKSGEFIKMDKLYKCALCNKYFKDSEFFLKHLHRKHTDVDDVGSMKILAEVQSRQQWCNSVTQFDKTQEAQKLNKEKPKKVVPAQGPAVPVPKPREPIFKTKVKPPTPTIQVQQTKTGKPPSRNPQTSMVRDIGVRLGVKQGVRLLVNKCGRPYKNERTARDNVEEGKIITAPSSDSSEEEIPGDETEVAVKKETDAKRWQEALSTGPPPKTIVPIVDDSDNEDAASYTSGTSSTASKMTFPAVNSPAMQPVVALSKLSVIHPTGTSGAKTFNVGQVAPQIGAGQVLKLPMSGNAKGNMVLMLPQVIGSSRGSTSIPISVPLSSILQQNSKQAKLGTVSSIPPGANVKVIHASPSTISSIIRPSIHPTTAAASVNNPRPHATYTIAPKPLERKVPTILRQRSSGIKVNPLLRPAPSSTQTATGSASSRSLAKETSSRFLNEEGYDIPQFIEYNGPPPLEKRPQGKRPRGRPRNPNSKPRHRKRRRKGRPHADSEVEQSSGSDEFDDWLTQVSSAADKEDKSKRYDSDDESRVSSPSQEDPSYNPLDHKNTRNFNCNLCPSKFYHSKQLVIHMKSKHKKAFKKSMKDASGFMYRCPECNSCFDKEDQFNFHVLSHMESEECQPQEDSKGAFQCPNCEEKFDTEDYLNYHMIKHQLASEEADVDVMT